MFFVCAKGLKYPYIRYPRIRSFEESNKMFSWSRLSKSCAKGMLIALNTLFIFIAISMFCCATVDMKILANYGDEQGGSATGDAVILVVSIFMVLLSLFGCLGTVRENEKTLYTYIMLLAGFLLMEIIITIFVSIQRFGLQYRVTEWLREDFYSNVTEDARVEHDLLWDKLQNHYECCGLNGPEDYAAIGQAVSVSCCHRAHLARTDLARKNMYKSCIESASYYMIGCEDEIINTIKSDGDVLLGIAVTGFWLEAVGILLAMLVVTHIRNSVHVYKHTVKY